VWIDDGGPSDELQAAAWAWRQKCIADIAGPPLNGMAQGPLARTDKALAWIGAFAGPSEYGVLRCLGRTFRRTSPVLDGFRRYFPQTLVLVPKPGVKPRARRAAIDTLVRALGSDAEQYLWPVLRGDPNVWTRMLAAKWLALIARHLGDAASKLRIFAAAADCYDAETSHTALDGYLDAFSDLLGAPEMERLFPGRALVNRLEWYRRWRENSRMYGEDWELSLAHGVLCEPL